MSAAMCHRKAYDGMFVKFFDCKSLRKSRVSALRKQFNSVKKAYPSRIAACAMATSGKSLKLFSPAKINIFLRVVRRREDGFHDLASLFHVIDLGDDMSFTVLPSDAGQDSLSCNMPDVPTDGSNLVVKALNLFRQKTGVTEKFSVDLFKRVPHGAGMGGGSGNAATTLWAANELCGRPASTPALLEWSGEIGSDVSVFFSSGAAYCTGRYEHARVQSAVP